MPKYGLDELADDSKPKPACSGIREDLRDCLLKSDCVVKVSLLVTIIKINLLVTVVKVSLLVTIIKVSFIIMNCCY